MWNICINRDNKPSTCCCGCSLICGIITLAVLNSLGIVGHLFSGAWGASLGLLGITVPMYMLIFMRENKTVGLVNVIIQGVVLASLILSIFVFAILISAADLPHYICTMDQLKLYGWLEVKGNNDSTDAVCEKTVYNWLWLGLVLTALISVPL